MGGTFQAIAGFQDSDIFQKAIKMVLRCILGHCFTFQDSNFNPVAPMLIAFRYMLVTNFVSLLIIFTQ